MKAYITKITNVQKHPNADRLNIGQCFTNSVVVSLETKEGDVGIYFPVDSQLGVKYAEFNNLVRFKDANGNNVGGYLEPSKRNIRALTLRGEKSDGLFMPLTSLSSFTNISTLKVGDAIDVLGGETICQKYIPRKPNQSNAKKGKKRKNLSLQKIFEKPKPQYPLFMEHNDTSQFAYSSPKNFIEGETCVISLKLHGTSQRTTNTLEYQPRRFAKFFQKLGLATHTKQWKTVSGTRRTILSSFTGGFYGNDVFRLNAHNLFENKLKKGETVFYEIVGYYGDQPTNTIMPICENGKIGDKAFTKKYGETTTFSYSCEVGQSDVYIYRMNMTNEDGDVVEYSQNLVELRAAQMGVKVAPVLAKTKFTTLEELRDLVNKYEDGVDPIGQNHIREGVIIRLEDREGFVAFKQKNFSFKVLEGMVKDNGVLDMEDAESVEKEENNEI